MKKVTVLAVLFMFLSASISYAQYGDYYDGTNSYSYDNMPKSKSKSKKRKNTSYMSKTHFVGISPSIYIPTSSNSLSYLQEFTSVGGGVDIYYKWNVHKLFGVATKLRYNYAGGSKKLEDDTIIHTDHNIIDVQLLAVLQYDSVKETKGFLPYLQAGMAITSAVINKTEKGSSVIVDADGATRPISSYVLTHRQSGANVGFTVGAGLRYAFQNNATVGIGVDYTHVFPIYDYSGVRVFLEAGYRF